MDLEPGSNLTILGPESLTIPNYDSSATDEYQIRAFTIDQEYEWSTSGAVTEEGTRRDGEFLEVSSTEPGPFSVSVTTTIDGEEYSGEVAGEADYPTVGEQATKYNALTTFGSLLLDTGLEEALASDSPESAINGWTAFAPSNEAFLNALDANGNGEIDDAELPAPGVLAKVLQYHVAVDSLTSSEVDGATPSTLLHPEETLSLTASEVEGTNGSSTLETVDIATNDGVVHQIDGVLLPASVVSINDQTVVRDTVNDVDSVAVEGTYVEDGSFVALHEGDPSGDIIGVSDYLDEGFHGNESAIGIELDDQLSDTTTVVAMPHRDNGDQVFDPAFDDPYTRGSSNTPVVDSASVAVP
ncbi:MAG: fasciclin domain-containing protein [Salinivenus sp.]